MYWAARPTIYLCRLAQYADTLMQLGGNTSSSATGPSTSVKRDNDSGLRGSQSRDRGKRTNGRSLIAHVEGLSPDNFESPTISSRVDAPRATTFTKSQVDLLLDVFCL